MKVKVDINQHIKELANELPYFEFIRMDKTWISGARLKLSGLKHDKDGKPWEDRALYELEVPVVKKLYPEDHEQSMRTAFLAHGLNGLYSYLANYLTPVQVQMIKNYFMRAQQ
jgi:hypothetical protein